MRHCKLLFTPKTYSKLEMYMLLPETHSTISNE